MNNKLLAVNWLLLAVLALFYWRFRRTQDAMFALKMHLHDVQEERDALKATQENRRAALQRHIDKWDQREREELNKMTPDERMEYEMRKAINISHRRPIEVDEDWLNEDNDGDDKPDSKDGKPHES